MTERARSSSPDLPALVNALRDGAPAGAAAAVREKLGLPPDAEDRVYARTLIARLATAQAEGLTASTPEATDPRAPAEPEVDESGGANATLSGSRVAALREAPTLVALLRGGTLAQRRAAAGRLVEVMGSSRKLPAEEHKLVLDALEQTQDPEVDYELAQAREFLPGIPGRTAREENERARHLAHKLSRAVRTFWDGEAVEEPILALAAEERALLLLRARELPDDLMVHLSALVEGFEGGPSERDRLTLLALLRYAGDPRLVPSLVGLLSSASPELALGAVRCLAKIDDPRVKPALLQAFDRTVRASLRAALAGALARRGDARGVPLLKELLGEEDPDVLAVTFEAVADAATFDDLERVHAALEHAHGAVVVAAVRALRRVGNGRSLLALRRLRDRAASSALRAEAEDSELAIRARLELRGEEAPVDAAAERVDAAARSAAAQVTTDPVTVRLRSSWDWFVGRLWLGLGAVERAVARFESAFTRRPQWARPLVSTALAYVDHDAFAQALPAFRRAIEVDRRIVERSAVVIRAASRAFLRRAEEMERAGRGEIALGLLEEALALDLRRADPAQRVELERRERTLRELLAERREATR